MDTKDVGNTGEDLACEYLVKNGYKIIGRNYRINFGEIDIVAQKNQKLFGENDKTIHFVEVKTLFHKDALRRDASQDDFFYPEEKVNYKKQNKYKRLAEVWLSKNKFSQDYPCQVDIIAVSINNREHEINYFENVVEG